MAGIDDILRDRDANTDAVIANFAAHLAQIESTAILDVVVTLHRKLTQQMDGTIDRTPANLRALRALDTMLMKAMDAAGLEFLISAFVEQFDTQVTYVQRLWQAMTQTMKTPLPPLKFSNAQKGAFVAEQLAAVDQLRDASTAAAIAAKQKALATFGGLNFKDLSETIQAQYEIGVRQSKTLADTLITNFFRSVNAASFDTIQETTPGGKPQRYKYSSSPDDAKTRPFCHAMIRKTRGQGLTRDEIDKLDNDNALSNVWLNCGGYNCRHVWLLDIDDLEDAWAAEKQRRSFVPQLAVQ